MSRLAALLAVGVLAVAGPAAACGVKASAVSAGPVPIVVDAAWLAARLADPTVRVVDMVSEPADYRRGHVPGAVRLDVRGARVAVAGGGYRVPTAPELGRILGALGIGPDTHVVAYDDEGGLHASRLFFTLEAYGHRRVSVLDGGVQAWRRAGHALTRDVPVVKVAAYEPAVEPGPVVTAAAVRAALGDPDTVIVDARTPAEYAGADVRAKRGGHIPGAVNLDWREHLRPDGTLKPADELRAMYAARGVTPGKAVITYCQTQHRASHTYLVLRWLGYPRVSGYDRSWAEWGNREDLPVAR